MGIVGSGVRGTGRKEMVRAIRQETSDAEIRASLHAKKFRRHHACPYTVVVDELGVAHGKGRVDIVVLNGCIHGYEIKSSKDTLSRLPAQLAEFSRSLEKLTVVVAPSHVSQLLNLIPDWCGIILAEKGRRGGINFRTLRSSRKNPDLDLSAMSRFLWRQEAFDLLASLGAQAIHPKAKRSELYNCIAAMVSAKELTAAIKRSFKNRGNWRPDRQPSLDDGSSLPVSK